MIIGHVTLDAALLSSKSANVPLWQSPALFNRGVDTRTYPLVGRLVLRSSGLASILQRVASFP